MGEYRYIKWFQEICKNDISLAGGKGANLGELTQKGVEVPPGFCITAQAYSDFVAKTGLQDKILEIIRGLDPENNENLNLKSAEIRKLFVDASIPAVIREEIEAAYLEFAKSIDVKNPSVAVRSSATAEDLPDASFAGQQDTYLHISGIEEVIRNVQKCWASLWTSRATYYRGKKGFDHAQVALSVVIQKMVNSEKSGVMFTANPVNNDRNQLMINASWGLGEAVVSGRVSPDEFILNKKDLTILERQITSKNTMVVKNEDGVGTQEVSVRDFLGADAVNKQCLSDDEVKQLAKNGLLIEELYGTPQDIEWGLDSVTKGLYILQARPITTLQQDKSLAEETKPAMHVLTKGLAASPGIARGRVVIVNQIEEIEKVQNGDVLVSVMTNPDMVPAMKKAVAVVTAEGGRTCHAAIITRELGIPCIVGTKNACEVLLEGMEITVDATRGVVYEGNALQEEEPQEIGLEKANSGLISEELLSQLSAITGTKIYMNLGEPFLISKYKHLPFDGIGLMRTEFIFTNMVGVHPMYLLKTGQEQLLIDKMAEGITKVAQEIFPRPIVVRLSDFRTNEFRGLKGGDEVEPQESNPMIGWRGVSRYISPQYEAGFRLECQALKKVREEYGLINVWAMLPFVRTTWELIKVKEIMASEGLVQNRNFKIWIMAEVPSVVFEAEEFAQLVDGFSIGSNDLTQLILGCDRDSGILNSMGYFDERDPAVKKAIAILIKAAHKYGKTISICGQGPSLYPELTEFLVKEGIDSVSVNPDTVAYTRRLVASVEQKMLLKNVQSN